MLQSALVACNDDRLDSSMLKTSLSLPVFVSAAQSCGPPPTVQNAQVHTHLQNATYVCNAGWQLVGPRSLFCLDNGTWSLPAPSCERMDPDHSCYCRSLFCSNHFICCFSGVSGQRLRQPQTDAARQSARAQPEHRARCGVPVR